MMPRSMVRKVGPKKCVRKSAYEKVRTKKSYFSSAWEYVKLPFSLKRFISRNSCHHYYVKFEHGGNTQTSCKSHIVVEGSAIVKLSLALNLRLLNSCFRNA
jgi:hypothetical protein